MFEYALLIREFHLDSYGHVNNATYLEILEEARWDFITKNGYGYKKVHELKQGPVILEINIKFKSELKLRETVLIRTSMVDYKGKIGHIKQEIIKEDGNTAAEAIFTIGLFDLANRRLIEPTDLWLKAIGLK